MGNSGTSSSSYHEGIPGIFEFEKGLDFYLGRPPHSQDFEKARRHFLKAAKAGYPPAQRAYAIMLSRGQGGEPDPVQSAQWMKKAAEQGEADAQIRYGMLCLTGTSVEKNAAAAGEWWEKAAAQNRPEAQHNLALLYLKGEGVAQNDVTGMSWLLRAAQGGYAKSQLYLGMIYMKGEDKKPAYLWLRRAADLKDPDAVKLLAELTPTLSPEIREAAERELMPAAAESSPQPAR